MKSTSKKKSMMKHEHRFFESCAAALSPDWCVKLNDKLTPGAINLASYTARLYLVDTLNGWTIGGAFAPSDFGLAAKSAKEAGFDREAVANAAGNLLAELSQSVEQDSARVDQCLQLVAAALTSTKCFQAVTEQGRGLAGHWVYLAYHGRDKTVTCRPVYLNADTPGFIQTDALMALLRQVVKQDTCAPGGAVARMLRRAGGAILAPAFR